MSKSTVLFVFRENLWHRRRARIMLRCLAFGNTGFQWMEIKRLTHSEFWADGPCATVDKLQRLLVEGDEH